VRAVRNALESLSGRPTRLGRSGHWMRRRRRHARL